MKHCNFCHAEQNDPCSSVTEARGCVAFKRAGTLSETARVACVPPRPEAPRFKLANLDEVGRLKKSLDYLDTIRRAVNGPTQSRITVDRIDLNPGLAASVVDAIEVAVDAEAAKIRDALADLGVEV